MSTPIKDGTGKGFLARVDSRNEISVSSRSADLCHVKSREGQAFAISTPPLDITTSTTGKIAYFKFTDSTKYFALHSLDLFWNGGSTNYNKTFALNQFTGGTVAPTANITSGTISNTNMGSSVELNATFLYWNGASTGMSGDVAMYSIGTMYYGPGVTQYMYDGIYILTPNTTLAYSVTVPEDGKVAMSLKGYVLEPGVDFIL
jgi:hypothetical protein